MAFVAKMSSCLGSVATTAKRARTKRGARDSGTGRISDVRADIENDMMSEITDLLHGDLEGQLLVVKMLREGLLKRKAGTGQDGEIEPVAADSVNKFNLLSQVNWAFILNEVDSAKFPYEEMVWFSKGFLLKVGTYTGRIDGTSALPSKKLKRIAGFIKARSRDVVHDRYKSLTLIFDPDTETVTEHNFDSGHGAFGSTRSEDKSTGKIFHIGTKVSVPMPASLLAFPGPIIFKNNHSEELAAVEGEYDDLLISKIFKKVGVDYPKPFWMKRMKTVEEHAEGGDSIDGSNAGTAAAGSIGNLTAENLNAHTDTDRVIPPASPLGSGRSDRPPAM